MKTFQANSKEAFAAYIVLLDPFQPRPAKVWKQGN